MSAADAIGEDEARALVAGLEKLTLVAVAVSGGRDSMALLRLMARWSRETTARPKLVALTVDHGLRPEARGEVAQVAHWCGAIGVEHQALVWDGPKPTSRIQERAREARYALMTGWARKNGAGALALAHHLEDQAETVLMRLARSSGVDGLAAMGRETSRDGVRIVRPLLAIARARLEATLAGLGQDWIDDPSNDDPVYERVRFRALAPAFKSVGLAPEKIGASAAKFARAAAALNQVADQAFAEAVSLEPAGHGWIDRSALAGQPDEIVMRVIARVLAVVGGAFSAADRALERAAGQMMADRRVSFTLGRCRIVGEGTRILAVRERRHLPRCVLAPGERRIWDDRFTVTLGDLADTVEVRALGPGGLAAARALQPVLGELPAPAGAVLPGGFRDGLLVFAPNLGPAPGQGAFSVRFLHGGVA